ncbi:MULTISPECIES: DinB family protein [unclassified Peribacillus]|uniref:DinB family protein n=1 Tax=unclassified Peribacillus TaxID=2675266 RepID=UPI0019118FA4|nr:MULTISPECIES: DinB family protein [unclassified Peribacillus]MBK5445513.1 DinB family protein [Peribacillus sp. TH24]MBK5459765.1 DinB family protein [Peribacillus sp. TH27]MBK5481574.1 DinB family protein [Peribacillus sp. TH16]MBK5497955.1 DinB family protein [Peribacillus sp. TH14]WMX56929.1 DinB family protein [Peribacillus sp. R9-11]
MAYQSIGTSIQSFQQSIDHILETTANLSEKTIRFNPTEEEWSIMQILSHIAEAIPYWLGEVETVVATPGSKWGRGLQDPARLAAVTDTEKLSVDEVLKQVDELKYKVESGLGKLDEETLSKESPHRNFAKFGNKPVSYIVDHFIDDHVSGHYDQIKRNLSKIK